MLVQEMDASAASASTDPGVPTAADGDFQAKIRAAMNKVNEGESTLQSDSASGSAPAPDSLEALLAQLNGLGANSIHLLMMILIASLKVAKAAQTSPPTKLSSRASSKI
jgi:hypothetical protein